MTEYIRMNDGVDVNDVNYGYIGHDGDCKMLGWMFTSATRKVADAISSLEEEHQQRDQPSRVMSKNRAIKALKAEFSRRY